MIHSMTGFGEARLDQDGHAYHVELRSVNNRYFKASVRVPDEFAFIEAQLEQQLRAKLTRGSMTLRLHLRDLSAAAAQDINTAAMTHYVEQLRAIEPAESNFTIDLAALTQLPGVCQPREFTEQQRQRCVAVIEQLTEQAIERLVEMRAVEGRALAEDLERHCKVTREHVGLIEQHAPGVIETYRDRLEARVKQLLSGSNVKFTRDDLLREVAIFAERSDVSEELSRLQSHLEQFHTAVAGDEPSGRKLEFIAQEMLREANTIGSKAGDAEIARHVIEIKGAIDRIKEQVQNVE